MAPKLRRPAAMPARVRSLRRPARASGEAEEEAAKPTTEEYNTLAALTLERLRSLDIVELGETSYYGGHAKIAGRILSLKPAEEEVEFELSGTLTDRVLERFGGGSTRVVKVHACPEGCPQLVTGDTYFHARGYWDTKVAPKPWHTNLIPAKGAVEEEVDELAGLRELALERGKGRGGSNPPKEKEPKEKEQVACWRRRETKQEEKEEGKDSRERVRRLASKEGRSRRARARPEDRKGAFQ